MEGCGWVEARTTKRTGKPSGDDDDDHDDDVSNDDDNDNDDYDDYIYIMVRCLLRKGTTFRIQRIWLFLLFLDTFRIQRIWSFLKSVWKQKYDQIP